MDIRYSNLNKGYKRQFGAFFTPEKWAIKIVENIFDAWLDGATVLDPTAGDGSFIKAFLKIAKQKNVKLTDERLRRLYGIELNRDYVTDFFLTTKKQFDIDFPKNNFLQGDILFQNKEIKADILVGNPPWVNFTDLNEDYKEKIKHKFIEYDLVNNPKDLLLGNARTDIATLIIAKTLSDNLSNGGKAVFFLPLSIFQNDGANQNFRKYCIKNINFSIEKIMDFNGEKVFDDVLSRYGIAEFQRNKNPKFPIPYFIREKGKWENYFAKPLFSQTDPLTVFENDEEWLSSVQKIDFPKYCQPRQGVNTCGANDIFFFSQFKNLNTNEVWLKNDFGDELIVNKRYVFPLTVSSTLSQEKPKIEKVILIPHFENGKPIDLSTLQKEKSLHSYLKKHEARLKSRKGVLINSWIEKGFWWALMGVGEYNFAQYKVIWKAFGDNTFTPKILSPDDNFGVWQGNQSLNAYIGLNCEKEALEIHNKLRNPFIQSYLSSLRMQGTCNWAQPGRMKKIMNFV